VPGWVTCIVQSITVLYCILEVDPNQPPCPCCMTQERVFWVPGWVTALSNAITVLYCVSRSRSQSAPLSVLHDAESVLGAWLGNCIVQSITVLYCIVEVDPNQPPCPCCMTQERVFWVPGWVTALSNPLQYCTVF